MFVPTYCIMQNWIDTSGNQLHTVCCQINIVGSMWWKGALQTLLASELPSAYIIAKTTAINSYHNLSFPNGVCYTYYTEEQQTRPIISVMHCTSTLLNGICTIYTYNITIHVTVYTYLYQSDPHNNTIMLCTPGPHHIHCTACINPWSTRTYAIMLYVCSDTLILHTL